MARSISELIAAKKITQNCADCPRSKVVIGATSAKDGEICRFGRNTLAIINQSKVPSTAIKGELIYSAIKDGATVGNCKVGKGLVAFLEALPRNS